MIEPPMAPHNDVEHDVEPENQNNKRLGIKEFIITLIMIFLVWAARQFFGQ